MKTITLLSLLTFFTLSSVSIYAQAGNNWDYLGKRAVNHTLDKDEIYVTRTEGKFNALKLVVEKSAVRFKKVVVHYRNGGTEELQMRDLIPAGGETRVMDLKGRRRVITKVVFFYDTQSLSGKKAVVKLYGRHF